MPTESTDDQTKQPNKKEEQFFFTHFYKSETDNTEKNVHNQKNRFLKILENIAFSPTTYVVVVTIPIAVFSGLGYVNFEDFTKRNNRAYLSISNPKFEKNLQIIVGTDTSYINRVKYSVKNSGKTPALNVSASVYFEYRSDVKIVNETDTTVTYFYSPGDNIRIKTFKEDFSKGWKPYFFGRIEYTDVFEQDHWITFCYQYIFIHDIFRFVEKCTQTDEDHPD